MVNFTINHLEMFLQSVIDLSTNQHSRQFSKQNVDSKIMKELESITEEELLNLIKAHKEYLALLENENEQ